MNIKCLSIATDNSHFHQTEKGLLMWRRRSKGAAEVYLHNYFLFHLSVLFWIHNTSVQAVHNLNFASYIGHVSFSQSLSHVRFFLSLRYSPFTAGLLLPFISFLQHRAHRCPSPRYFSQWKRRMKREHPALFSSFFPPWGVFVVRSVAELPPTPPTHHPCGLPSDLWSEGGTENFKLFSSCKCSAAS